jgi:hypothetical protein
MAKREFEDDAGHVWEARVISTGNSSSYLSEKVQRPIVEFRCTGVSRPTRYVMLGKALPDSLDQIDDAVLKQMFERSKSH